MASSKDIFEPRTFLPRIFAAGAFRGLGVEPVAAPPDVILPVRVTDRLDMRVRSLDRVDIKVRV